MLIGAAVVTNRAQDYTFLMRMVYYAENMIF